MIHTRGHLPFVLVLVAVALVGGWARSVYGAPDGQKEAGPAGGHTVTIMPLDEVKPGMKGYGLTVYAGTTVEPFPVEVLSVMRDFGPQRGVVWIRCTDERMAKLGPVSGMSGSPIYLWGRDDAQELGKGGRLIGAFAYGFGGATDCIVGVQPVELMRQVASRATPQPEEDAKEQAKNAADHRAGTHAADSPASMMAALLNAARNQGVSKAKTWRFEAMARLAESVNATATVESKPLFDHGTTTAQERVFPIADHAARRRHPDTTALRPLAATLAVSSPEVARWLGPMVEPMGLLPVAGGGKISPAGFPPIEINPETIRFEPGSVLSIPLAYGDLDLSAVGTVTEVLPDGRVTGFGHSLFADGATAVPMATGYVHLVVPTLFGSFKLGGSAMIRGAITRDENSAVVGRPDASFNAAPVQVVVAKPGFADRTYRYQVVDHPSLTALVTGLVTSESVTAEAGMPTENTVHLTGSLRFTGGRQLKLDSLIPGGSGFLVMVEMLPTISMMMRNPYEPMALEAADVRVDVDPIERSGLLVNAKLDREEVEPGQTIGVTVEVQGYRSGTQERRIEVPVPVGTTPGEYFLVVSDADNYVDLLMDTHPHFLLTRDLEDYQAVIQQLLSIPGDALNVILVKPAPGLAVGREEMPDLPSSRRAVLETGTSTYAMPYQEWIEQSVPMGMVLHGSMQFTVQIK